MGGSIMSPEKQRIAIAEACGYTDVCMEEWESVDIESRSIAYGTELQGTINGKRCFIPNYLHDLNAMHEAEKVLRPMQRELYRTELVYILAGADIFATATQRAESFLHAIGKWEDGE